MNKIAQISFTKQADGTFKLLVQSRRQIEESIDNLSEKELLIDLAILVKEGEWDAV